MSTYEFLPSSLIIAAQAWGIELYRSESLPLVCAVVTVVCAGAVAVSCARGASDALRRAVWLGIALGCALVAVALLLWWIYEVYALTPLWTPLAVDALLLSGLLIWGLELLFGVPRIYGNCR